MAAKNHPLLRQAENDLSVRVVADENYRKKEWFEAVERQLFKQDLGGATFADLLQDQDEEVTQGVIEEYTAELVAMYTDERVLESAAYVNQGFGLLLVRPEVLHATKDIYAFLDANDIDIIARRDIQLDAEQCIALYSHIMKTIQ